MASVLIHACCAPCATYTVEHWRGQKHEISGYWFNPNIHPSSEHELRLQTLKDYARNIALPIIIAPGYQTEDYFRAVDGHRTEVRSEKSEVRSERWDAAESHCLLPTAYVQLPAPSPHRCRYCYLLRLHNAARAAKEEGFDAFTTTLLISPYQNLELLKRIGEELQAKVGVRFLYEDLRPGYRESRRMAKELNLYRQKYCGCLYSDAERKRCKDSKIRKLKD